MSRETHTIGINTAQPMIDVLTAQPNHGRVLTETVQPQGSMESLEVPLLISGVAPPETQTAVKSDTTAPVDEGS